MGIISQLKDFFIEPFYLLWTGGSFLGLSIIFFIFYKIKSKPLYIGLIILSIILGIIFLIWALIKQMREK